MAAQHDWIDKAVAELSGETVQSVMVAIIEKHCPFMAIVTEPTRQELQRRCDDMETVFRASSQLLRESLQAIVDGAGIYRQFVEGLRVLNAKRRIVEPRVLDDAVGSSRALLALSDKVKAAISEMFRVAEEVKARRIADGLDGETW